MTIYPVDCQLCGDDGFVWIQGIRYSSAPWRRKRDGEFASVAHREQFRYPCSCKRGKKWVKARKRGEELPDPEDD